MLSKKKPSADIDRRRGTFLLLGLVAVLSLIYAGFELTASSNTKEVSTIPDDEYIMIVDQTKNTDQKMEAPKKDLYKEQILKTIKKDIFIPSGFIDWTNLPDDHFAVDTTNIIIIPPDPEDFEIKPFAKKMPTFPGGEVAFKQYIQNELVYPEESRKLGVEGVVLVQFVVEKDGSVSNPKVLISAYPDLDQEAMRVILKSPKWNPGENFGHKVRVYFQMPIHFKIAR